MLEENDLLQALRRHWEYSGKDEDIANEIYHDDVREFPQSGERFEGVENFRELRRQHPARLKFRTRRIAAVPSGCCGERDQLRRLAKNVHRQPDGVQGRPGGARADLHHVWLGCSGVAQPLALRDPCRPPAAPAAVPIGNRVRYQGCHSAHSPWR